MQATADVTKKECSWSSWKGQGTDVFTVIYSSFFCVCGSEKLSLHVGLIFMTLVCSINVSVCFACAHLSNNCICQVLANQTVMFTCASFHMDTP